MKKPITSDNSGTTWQLNHPSASVAEKKPVKGDNVSMFKPAQISATGREPLSQRPATQGGRRNPK